MDNALLKNIFYKLLDDYKIDIDKMLNKWDRSPLKGRMYLLWIIDYLHEQGIDTLKMMDDFKNIDVVFAEYKMTNREEYLKNTHQIFKAQVERYDPSSILIDGYEFENEIYRRTEIEILYDELKSVFNLEKDMENVRRLDDEFRKMIPKAIKMKTYSPEDSPYIPREYWWRHLEDVYGKYEYDSINDKLIPVK